MGQARCRRADHEYDLEDAGWVCARCGHVTQGQRLWRQHLAMYTAYARCRQHQLRHRLRITPCPGCSCWPWRRARLLDLIAQQRSDLAYQRAQARLAGGVTDG